MPTQIVDDFGSWEELGVVQPVFEDWLTFPDFTRSPSELIRLQFIFDEFDSNSYGYIRCKYELDNTYAFGRWLRFYPKLQPELMKYPHPSDLVAAKSNPRRIYQVMKRHRRRSKIGTLRSTLWSVNLNVFNENLSDDSENSN